MPYLYQVEIRESSIQGKGMFALEDIPAGVVYWVYSCQNPLLVKGYATQDNKVYSKEQLEGIEHEEIIKEVLHGGLYYADGDVFIQFKDGSQFMNHSDSPNSQIIYPASRDYLELKSKTLKSIYKGEEINESYSNYFSRKSQWVINLMEKYYPCRKQFENSIVQKEEQK